jgi:threonine dehydrogenase-like Zn-dependent dehydrogenase
MKAIVRRGGQLIEAECEEITPGPGQVLVATHACGICGSDLHAVKGLERMLEQNSPQNSSGTLDASRDLVLGHEFCAEILDHGPQCSRRFKAGTRVVSVPWIMGPDGQELVGFSSRFPGGFGERMVLDEARLLAVPNGLSSEVAAMTEPLAVGTHAAAALSLADRPVALILGCGPVGLAVIASLKARGIGPVVACDFAPGRRAIAARMGADVVIDPATVSPHAHWEKMDVPATLASLTIAELAGRDVRRAAIFDCTGAKGILQSIIEEGPPHAQIIVVGTCAHPDTILPVLALRKQLRFDFTYAYTATEFAATLANIAEGRIDVSPMLSRTVGRAEVADIFDELSSHQSPLIKVSVAPGRS